MKGNRGDYNILKRETVCAVVLLNSQGDALLQLRDIKPGLNAAGMWVFPGGHKQDNEDLWTCAIREFYEETNYPCKNLNWLMQINDTYVSQTPLNLHVFWDLYNGYSPYLCLEGQDLRFISRKEAEKINMPIYLLKIWDLVLIATIQSRTKTNLNSTNLNE